MNKKNVIFTVLAAALLFVMSSCDRFEGEQEVPSYINVKGFRLVENPNAGFSFIQDSSFLTNAITEVAVFVSDGKKQEELGVYTLKEDGSLTIPILKKGKSYIELEPVVKLNGMNATRAYYYFYSSALDTVELQEGKVTVIDTKDVYYTANTYIAKRLFFEDTFNPFENVELVDSTIECRLHMIGGTDSVAYGTKCGAFYSASSSENYKVITKDSIVGTGNKTMILELDYCSNIPFEVGIYGQASSASQPAYISSVRMAANFNPALKASDKNNWHKMYITLGKVWANINYAPFKLWFMPVNSANNPKGFVHIDNIKLVTYRSSGK
ncbi:MAG: hypothetical protein IJ759_07265 [Bacteroidales bacterium]|nr:hypothetical protein [Bacteroidales bacterium]